MFNDTGIEAINTFQVNLVKLADFAIEASEQRLHLLLDFGLGEHWFDNNDLCLFLRCYLYSN